eukprot:s425_g29.t1
MRWGPNRVRWDGGGCGDVGSDGRNVVGRGEVSEVGERTGATSVASPFPLPFTPSTRAPPAAGGGKVDGGKGNEREGTSVVRWTGRGTVVGQRPGSAPRTTVPTSRPFLTAWPEVKSDGPPTAGARYARFLAHSVTLPIHPGSAGRPKGGEVDGSECNGRGTSGREGDGVGGRGETSGGAGGRNRRASPLAPHSPSPTPPARYTALVTTPYVGLLVPLREPNVMR